MNKVQLFYEKAKHQAYKKRVPTIEILKPYLIKNGYMKENGVAIKAWGVMMDFDEDYNQVPKKKHLNKIK
tara:strand:- start:127 stop:336 length:210 start_codon:yes stop_codon:yes gene_type:complete